jgi:hypothetical protein
MALTVELPCNMQYALLFDTVFEVLEGPIHGGNHLKSNCNYRDNESRNNKV